MKGRYDMISNNKDHEALEYLYKAILTLETPEEAAEFLDDICTVPEIRAISQRLQVARMLYTNHVYTDIVSETGASTATISRVNRTLNDGREIGGKGYHIVLERMGEIPGDKKKKDK